MQTREDAVALAKSMVTTGNRLAMAVTAQVTEMDNPIGRMYGNSHEIVECIQCLKGEGPTDTMELVCAQAGALGYDIRDRISDGSALREFEEMCIRQDVDRGVISQLVSKPWSVLDRAPVSTNIVAKESGYISQINALTIGEVLCKLGAGRTGENPDIDHGVGAELLFDIGDKITAGEPWIRFDTREEMSVAMNESIQRSLSISETKPTESSRIIEIIESQN